MKSIVLCCTLVLLATQSIAQTSDSLKYFPADSGDEWVYYVQYSPTQGEFKTIKIDSVRSLPFGRLAYMGGDNERGPAFVLDTTNGFINVVYAGENPDSVDSLVNPYRTNANLGNYWWLYPRHYGHAGVSAQFDTTVFGVRKKVKEFSLFGTFQGDTSGGQDHNPDTWFTYFSEQYAYGIGMIYRYVEPGEGWFLIGAVIDGDTLGTLTSVKEERIPVPKSIKLNQNYPNPFNPTTTITYSLPKRVYVQLVVYNDLGQEVRRLVDTEQPPGNYAVTFDGDGLASGAYFYVMRAGTMVLHGKALLLK